MNLAPPIPRFGRPFGEEDRERKRTKETRRAANRTPAKDLTNALQRATGDDMYIGIGTLILLIILLIILF
jgi:hypothetical protein